MKVIAVYCKVCKCLIFSRSRHDMRWCPGQHISIDGGTNYVKLSFDSEAPETKQIDVSQSSKELYDDWNKGEDKFGIIKET